MPSSNFTVCVSGIDGIRYFTEEMSGSYVITAMRPGENGFYPGGTKCLPIHDPSAVYGPESTEDTPSEKRGAFEEARAVMLSHIPAFVREVVQCVRLGHKRCLLHCWGGKQRSAYLALVLLHLVTDWSEEKCARHIRSTVSPHSFTVFSKKEGGRRELVSAMTFRGVLDLFVNTSEYAECRETLRATLSASASELELTSVQNVMDAERASRMNAARW